MFPCVLVLLVSLMLATVHGVNLTIPDSYLEGGVVAGSPLNISWTSADGAIGIFLKNGTTNAVASVVTFDLTGTSFFLWTPSPSLPNGVYKLQLGDSSPTPAYSNQFTLTGGGIATTSQQISDISSSTTLVTSSHHRSRTGTWTHQSYPTCTSSACSTPSPPPPPPPPSSPTCSTSCMRNLNGTRVTHTASLEVASSTSTSSTKAMTKTTQNSGLSDSAKVAIGVGAALGSSIVITLATLTFCHGRKVRRESTKGIDDKYMMHGAVETEKPVELDAGFGHNILEIDGRRRDMHGRENG